MRLPFCLSLLMLSVSYGCDSEVRRRAQEVAQIAREAKQKPESMEALERLTPYLKHKSAFVRSTACQSLGETYAGTQNDEIASKCASILCERLDDYDQTIVAKAAARALVKVGLPSGHPDTATIEWKLRNAAKDLIEWDASWYAIDALAVIEKPTDETFNTLVACFHSMHNRHHAASALARFGSRASVVLPELKKALAETPPSWEHREIAAAIKSIENAVEKGRGKR